MIDFEKHVSNSKQRDFLQDIFDIGVKIAKGIIDDTEFKSLLKYVEFIGVPSDEKNVNYDVNHTIGLRKKYLDVVNNFDAKIKDPDVIVLSILKYQDHIQSEKVDISKDRKFDLNDFD